MSTHFRPRPPSAPSSPVRPSTAQSTIRAVPPSPSDSIMGATNSPPELNFTKLSKLSRHSSNQSRGSKETATDKDYAAKADHDDLSDSSDATAYEVRTKRASVASPNTSPTKARSRSPKKQHDRTPTRSQRQREGPKRQPMQAELSKHEDHATQNEASEYPTTPSAIPRNQKRRAYKPLSASHHPLKSPTKETQDPKHPAHPTTPPPHTRPPLSPRSSHRSHPYSPPTTTRASISSHSNNTSNSVTSRHSIFSTPGRDELERKKAMVEVDEGPFGRVTSMGDLDMERSRISSGMGEKGWSGREEEKRKRKEWGEGGKGCGIGCSVM